MRDISVAAVAALLALSCQSDNPHNKRPAPERPPEPVAPGELVIDQSPAPSIDLDCAALLTATDLANMCGVEAAFEADPFETGQGATRCSRRTAASDHFVRYAVGVYPHVQSARSVTRGVAPGAVKVETSSASGARSITAHMRRGNIAVSVSATQLGSKEPLCTADQLSKLAMIVDSRLP